jgi:hypothetical protein
VTSSDDRSDCNLSFLSAPSGEFERIDFSSTVQGDILLCFPALNVHLVFASARSPTHFDVPLHV